MKLENIMVLGIGSAFNLTLSKTDVLDVVQNLSAMLAGQKSNCVFRSGDPEVEFCLDPALSGFSILLRWESKPGWPLRSVFTFSKKSAENLAVMLLREVICGSCNDFRNFRLLDVVTTEADAESHQLRIRFDFEK